MRTGIGTLIPSGRQTVVSFGDQTLVVVEVGGGIRRYTVDGNDVLDGYSAGEMCQSGRGQLLVPWPNRLRGGAYEVDGVRHHTALTEPDAGNAIHGLGRFANWSVAEQRGEGVTLAHRLHAQPGYPWTLDLEVDYSLGPQGLEVTMSATNRSDRRCPYGAGAHPYLMVGDGGIDDLILRSPAATYYDSDEHGIPVSSHPVEGTDFDFRSARRLGNLRLDTAFTDLERGADGRAVVELSSRERRVQLWLGPHCPYLMLFTGDSLPDPARRRRALGVEPMTCAPDAFRNGYGLKLLEPGERTSATWGIGAGGAG